MLKGVFSYWMLPLFSAVVWFAMVLALLLHWITSGRPYYRSENDGQTIIYISDVGAFEMKPLFIAMGTVSVVTFDLAFIAERWLRHRGRLVHNTSTTQKVLAILSIVFAIIGAAGLIMLTIFDTWHHPSLHNVFLSLFIGGYVISACFTCAEYQRLGKRFREFSILRVSFWMKLAFILVEVVLAIVFGVLNRLRRWNDAAIVEWIIALVYTFWVISFVIDFLPATRTKNHVSGQTMTEVASGRNHEVANDTVDRYGRPLGAESSTGHYPSGTSNGWHSTKEEGARSIV